MGYRVTVQPLFIPLLRKEAISIKFTPISSSKRNRGPHPKDTQLFDAASRPALLQAVTDLSYLLTRGYGINAALALVGDRYRLNKRQRKALLRMSASDQEVALRQSKSLEATALKDQAVAIDGFNLLILLESALSGAYLFQCRDGLYRDISSVHGSYKRVIKTEEAILLVGKQLRQLQVGRVLWLLDSPISNSGRLKTFLLEIAQENNFNWDVELVFNPDKELAETEAVVISSDGWILDHCRRWYNLGRQIIELHLPQSEIVRISDSS